MTTIITHRPPVANTPVSAASGPTAEERMICALVAQGRTDDAIATYMGVSRRTAEQRVHRFRVRVGAASRAHLVYIAMKHGWIE